MVENKPVAKSTSKPWSSISAGVFDVDHRGIPFQEALSDPCATCQTSPCCTHLPLQSFKVTNMVALDRARYLLNFDRIELGLAADGEWSVYYVYPCRFLNTSNFTCSVHQQPEQPQICRHFNPYDCIYKRSFATSVSDKFLQIDQIRMDYIVSKIVFDEERNIREFPDWAALIEELPQLPGAPFSKHDAEPAVDAMDDLALRAWKDLAVSEVRRKPVPQESRRYDSFQDPCSGCEAYCCKVLSFPQDTPKNITNLDYLQFCLGFPGIELGIADEGWSLVVRSTCRHLENNRCSVFGEPDRPLICKYYDAWKCTFKVNFGLPRVPGYVRVNLEQFEPLSAQFKFDDHGNIIASPAVDTIRGAIEDNWRKISIESIE